MITLAKHINLYDEVSNMDEMEQYLLLRSALRNLDTARNALWKSDEERSFAEKLFVELQSDWRIIKKVALEQKVEMEKRRNAK